MRVTVKDKLNIRPPLVGALNRERDSRFLGDIRTALTVGYRLLSDFLRGVDG